MKHLNSIRGFSWVSAGNNSEGFGKATIQNESFWLRECIEKDGVWQGIVDNQLLMDDLKYNERVTFTLERKD